MNRMPATVPAPASAASPAPLISGFERLTEERWAAATRLLVQLALLLAGMNVVLPRQLTLDFVLSLVLLPMWLPALRRYRFATTVLVLAVAAVLSGIVLSYLSAPDHAIVTANRIASCVRLLGGAGMLGLLLWARTLFPLSRVAGLYGLGMLLAAAADRASYDSTGWKFAFATPVTIVVLAVLERRGARVPAAVAVIALGVAGVADQARSFFGFCLITAALTLWQAHRRADRAPVRWAPALLLAVLAGGIYQTGSTLLTGGYLGSTLQDRSVAQIDAAGSLIAGGRPEWFGTLQLMAHHLTGFGAGVVPSWLDVTEAERGLNRVGLAPGNGYVEHYMFGGQFRLHSIVADLWVSFGLVGLGFGLFLGYLVISRLSALIAEHRCAAVVVFTSSLALWTLAFGPIYSNWDDVCFALGLLLPIIAGGAGAEQPVVGGDPPVLRR